MLMLGLAIAVSIRIGKVYGAGEFHRIRRIGFSGQALAGAAMLVFALVFVFGKDTIARIFTSDPELLELTASLLIIAAFFQLADGMQVVCLNALRGMKDVKMPAAIAGFSYWLVAVPLGWFLGFGAELGAHGIWIGLASGLFTAAVIFSLRFHLLTKKHPEDPSATKPGILTH